MDSPNSGSREGLSHLLCHSEEEWDEGCSSSLQSVAPLLYATKSYTLVLWSRNIRSFQSKFRLYRNLCDLTDRQRIRSHVDLSDGHKWADQTITDDIKKSSARKSCQTAWQVPRVDSTIKQTFYWRLALSRCSFPVVKRVEERRQEEEEETSLKTEKPNLCVIMTFCLFKSGEECLQ